MSSRLVQRIDDPLELASIEYVDPGDRCSEAVGRQLRSYVTSVLFDVIRRDTGDVRALRFPCLRTSGLGFHSHMN